MTIQLESSVEQSSQDFIIKTKEITKTIKRKCQTKNLLINYGSIISKLIKHCYRIKNKRNKLGLKKQEYDSIINILKKKQDKLSIHTFKKILLQHQKLCEYLISIIKSGKFQRLILQSSSSFESKLNSFKYLNMLFNAFHSPKNFNRWKQHLTPQELAKKIKQRNQIKKKNRKLKAQEKKRNKQEIIQKPKLDKCQFKEHKKINQNTRTKEDGYLKQDHDKYNQWIQQDYSSVTGQIPLSQQEFFKHNVKSNQSLHRYRKNKPISVHNYPHHD